MVRRKGGGEMLALFHSRAKSVDVDDQAERYSDRPFDKMFDVLAMIRSDLAPVFDGVSDPFPEDGKKRNPSISMAIRERIVLLRREGKEYKDIARDCGVSSDTVRRYLKQAGLVRAYKKAVNHAPGLS
jgi:hypothetical protein